MTDRPTWQIAAAAAAALLLLLAGVRAFERARGGEVARVSVVAPGSVEAPGRPSRVRPATPPRAKVFVHVAGAVRRPGVYSLAVGSRAAAALERAGGPLRKADLAAVNLAAKLSDGQQLVVPLSVPAPTAAAAPAGAAAGAGPTAPISLAAATPEQLEQLDGIGPALAARIVEYREKNGGFRSVDALREVEGIGEKRFAALRDAVRP